MAMIRAPEANELQGGWSKVDVGILDSGIDGNHVDFSDLSGASNVDCARGRDMSRGFDVYGFVACDGVGCVRP